MTWGEEIGDRWTPDFWLRCGGVTDRDRDFLFALLRYPLDPVLRAGYADWLEGEGRLLEAAVQRVPEWYMLGGSRGHALGRCGQVEFVGRPTDPVPWARGRPWEVSPPRVTGLALSGRVPAGKWGVFVTRGEVRPVGSVRPGLLVVRSDGPHWNLRPEQWHFDRPDVGIGVPGWVDGAEQVLDAADPFDPASLAAPVELVNEWVDEWGNPTDGPENRL